MTQKLYTRKKIEVIPQVTREKQLDIPDVLKLDMDVTLLLDIIEVNTPLNVCFDCLKLYTTIVIHL